MAEFFAPLEDLGFTPDGRRIIRTIRGRVFQLDDRLAQVLLDNADTGGISSDRLGFQPSATMRLKDQGVLVPSLRGARRNRWERVPGGVKGHVADPGRLLVSLGPALRPLLANEKLLGGGLIALFLALLMASPSIIARLDDISSISAVDVALFLVLQLLAMFLHELAHGAALVALGGRCRSMGVMLLYGVPALYCDVTSAWTLPRRSGVKVALAGPCVQLALGLAYLSISSVAGFQLAGASLVWLAFFNLLPFVRFDGYVALTLGQGRPFLRRDAMKSASQWLATGKAHASARRIVFGLGCLVCPWLLVGSAVISFANLGALINRACALAAIGAFAGLFAYRAARRLSSEDGARTWAALASCAAAVGLFGLQYAIIAPWPDGSYVRLADGRICGHLNHRVPLREHAQVSLSRWTPLGRLHRVRVAATMNPTPQSIDVPLNLLLPGLKSQSRFRTTCFMLNVGEGAVGDDGVLWLGPDP